MFLLAQSFARTSQITRENLIKLPGFGKKFNAKSGNFGEYSAFDIKKKKNIKVNMKN